MDELRGGFFRFKEDIEHRLGRNKRKADEAGLGDRDESVGSRSSVPQREPHVSMGGGREQEGDGPNIENENIGASGVVDEDGPGWSSSAKLVLRTVRDSADAFGLLKSVAGGLFFILENCEVWYFPSYAIGGADVAAANKGKQTGD